jgi:hypothetical protein
MHLMNFISAPIHWVPRALSLGVKQPGHEADHSPPSSVEVKNVWSYTSTPPIHLHGVVLSWAEGALCSLLISLCFNAQISQLYKIDGIAKILCTFTHNCLWTKFGFRTFRIPKICLKRKKKSRGASRCQYTCTI